MEINDVFPYPPHLRRLLRLRWLAPARPERLDHRFNPLLQLLIQYNQQQDVNFGKLHTYLSIYVYEIKVGLQAAPHPLADDEVLLLLDKKGVELIDLGIEKLCKLRLGLGRWVGAGDEADQLLEILIGEELVPPLWKGLLYLLL